MLYKRYGEDPAYWAVTNGRKLWTHSPFHHPSTHTVYKDPEVAKRAVDYYIDEMVPFPEEAPG